MRLRVVGAASGLAGAAVVAGVTYAATPHAQPPQSSPVPSARPAGPQTTVQASATPSARALSTRDCTGGTRGGTIDYSGATAEDTVADPAPRELPLGSPRTRGPWTVMANVLGGAALAAAEGYLPGAITSTAPSLTWQDPSTQLWTYHDPSGTPVAEVRLDKLGPGWKLTEHTQCRT